MIKIKKKTFIVIMYPIVIERLHFQRCFSRLTNYYAMLNACIYIIEPTDQSRNYSCDKS